MAKKWMAYGKLGFLAAIVTGFLLKFISELVSKLPGVELDLQAISISTTGLGEVINPGLSTYAEKLFGLVPVTITGMEWIFLGVGGALFMILGAKVSDMLGLLKGSRSKQLTTVFVVAGILSGWILSMQIAIPAITAIVIMIVNAYILSLIFVGLDRKGKLVP